jgi:hypothetical protein
MSAPEDGLVRFPPGTTTRCLGRNGTFITTGIYVDSFNHKITLTPQNSRRDMARCAIELPNDARVLLGLILEILKASPGTQEALQRDLAASTESSMLRH